MSKRCSTCGGEALVKGSGGVRACLEHVGNVDEPRWLRLDAVTHGPAGPSGVARELVELGALSESTLGTVDAAVAALADGDGDEFDRRLDAMLDDAADADS